jgi:hypothetical protein
MTALLKFNLTVQVDEVPEHEPDQPENVEPEAGDAVRVTVVPEVTEVEQVEPQLIGPPDTVPEPVPDFVTERV